MLENMLKTTLFGSVCLTAIALIAPEAAHANGTKEGAPGEGCQWYVSMFGGLSVPEKAKSRFVYTTAGATPYTSTKKHKDGFIVGLAAGTCVFTDSVRGELEFAFNNLPGRSINNTNPVFGAFGGGLNGSFDSYTILGNLWYDFYTNTDFTPFIGGGVGVGVVDSSLRVTGGIPGVFDDAGVGLAFQAGAGFKYDVAANIDLELSYRFRGIVDFDLSQTNRVVAPFWGKLRGVDLFTHTVMGGITFKFDGL
ncbi:MAG: outer membrane beta-barrel protein [Pseudomonadota bacterium]